MLPNLCEWMQRDGTQVFRDLDEMLRAVENPDYATVWYDDAALGAAAGVSFVK